MNRLIKEKLIGTTIAIISAMKMKLFATVFLSIIFSYNTLAQEQNNSNKKIIGEITVSGNTTFSPITIITYSGLSEGDEVSIPGEKISSAIKKLWESDLFSSVEVYKIEEVDNVVDLEIRLIDLPELSELEITGVKKRKYEDIIKENKLQIGVKVTENLITTTTNYLENKYKKKGYLNKFFQFVSFDLFNSKFKCRYTKCRTLGS